MKFIFHPGESSVGVPLGGKARGLAALRDADVNIPEWLAVLPNAFTRVADASTGAVWTLLPTAELALQKALHQLNRPGQLWAVRSSAAEEDGAVHSFAGQLESFLQVPTETVTQQVLAVVRSAASDRVRRYREQHQLAGDAPVPAVIVQRMLQPEAAGVAFGIDPVSGDTQQAVISGVRGLGDRLVDGECNADTWHVGIDGRLTQRSLSGPEAVLADPQIMAVAQLVRRISRILGQPQDIEWAFAAGRLHLLQARPITTPTARGPRRIWDNSNIIESYSGVTTPLTFSFAQRAYEGVYRQFCQILAVPHRKIRAHDETFRQMIGLVHGRVYYQLLNWYRVLALLPGFTLNRRFMEQMMGVKEELPAEILAELGTTGFADRLRDAVDLSFSVAALVGNHFLLPRKIRQFQARFDAALAPPGKALTEMSAEELVAYFEELERRLLTRWDAPLLNDFFAMIFFGVLRKLSGKWLGDADGTLSNDLLCDEGGIISAEPARRIAELARLAAPHPELVATLCTAGPAELNAHLEHVPEFASAYQAYLDKFGERCLEELKLETLTLHDDPQLLLRAIGQFARSSSNRSDRTDTRGGDAAGTPRELAEARWRQALQNQPTRRTLFGWVLCHTRDRVRHRENLRFERTRLFGRVRRLLVELGRRWHTAGHLEDPRDVFYLHLEELLTFPAARSTPAESAGLRRQITARKIEFASYRAGPAPPRRFTTYGDIPQSTTWSSTPAADEPAPGETRRGIGCCPGIVCGRIRKVSDPRSAVLQPGEILVAERTDPGWILIFPSAAGLLIERGSLLSHSAIVARELGLPAIVAIDGLMAWLNDGDVVEFDGRTGLVSRHGRSPDASVPEMFNIPLSIRTPQTEPLTVAP